MGEDLKEMFRKVSSPRAEDADELCESASLSTADSGDSMFSSSSDLTDDATSSSSPKPFSTSSNASKLDSDGPVFEFSLLMAHLPIKRGLSKYFQGKSQSFSSLSDARCIEDLAKKETPYKKMKPCKSYAGNLDAGHKPCHTPGPCNRTIAKKTSRGSCSSLVNRRSTSSLLSISKPPPIPVNKNL